MNAWRTRRSIGLFLLLVAASAGGQPRVYRWVDANGVVHYSDAPPPESQGVTAEPVIVPSSPAGATPPPVRSTRAATGRPEETSSAPPATAAPTGCSTLSPLQINGSLDALSYDPPPPLTANQIELLETVFDNLAYRWTGSQVGFACDGDTRSELNRTVVAEGRATSRDGFELDTTVSSRDTNRQERLNIRFRDQRLWVNSGYASLIAVSDRLLELGYAERRGGVVWERSWRLETDGRRAMRVEQVTYTNGALTESTAWETSKPY